MQNESKNEFIWPYISKIEEKVVKMTKKHHKNKITVKFVDAFRFLFMVG